MLTEGISKDIIQLIVFLCPWPAPSLSESFKGRAAPRAGPVWTPSELTALRDLALSFAQLLPSALCASVRLTSSFPNKICPVLSPGPLHTLLLLLGMLPSLPPYSFAQPRCHFFQEAFQTLLNEWCMPLLFARKASHMLSIIMLTLLYIILVILQLLVCLLYQTIRSVRAGILVICSWLAP